MLRARLGDDRFWAGIRDYYRRYQDANASTDDFREVMEHVSGEDLAPMFRQWLYRGGVPQLSGTWSYDPTAKTVTLELRQVQPGAPFHLTVEVAIQTPGAASRVERVEMTGADGRATFAVGREPAALVLDLNVRLLAATELSRR